MRARPEDAEGVPDGVRHDLPATIPFPERLRAQRFSSTVCDLPLRGLRRADYLRYLLLTPGAAKEARVWAMLDCLTGRFAAAWERAMLPVWRTRGTSLRTTTVTVCVIAGVQWLAFTAVGWAAAALGADRR